MLLVEVVTKYAIQDRALNSNDDDKMVSWIANLYLSPFLGPAL